MRYEGVTFVAENCKKLTKAAFIKMHLPYLWLDRDEDVRKKMLTEVWSRLRSEEKSE